VSANDQTPTKPSKETHESYGLVRFTRVQHGGKSTLFGSAIRDHHTTIELTISRATIEHSLHHDTYYDIHPHLIRVEMSAHQFSELLTTMNIGLGVPCTIRYVGKEQMAEPEVQELESEKIVSEFAKSNKKLVADVISKVRELKPILEAKGPLKVGDKTPILELLHKIERELLSNVPFAAEMFQEATAKMVTTAKAEVDAFLVHVVNKAGIAALKEGREDVTYLLKE
jgi:hypothetical protein